MTSSSMSPVRVDGSNTWATLSAAKRDALAASIPDQWRVPHHLMPSPEQIDVIDWPEKSGWFTDEELSITKQSASQLLSNLVSGRLQSTVVTTAFCKRACAAHALTNCLTETCFDHAMKLAERCDAYLRDTGKTIGPLHGLPISLKDNFKVKGLDSTIGLVSNIDNPAQDDSTLVKLLESAGAVIYVKTNVPPAMMMAETVNNVFGRTVNPRNRLTTCGGSSGGEAALIALRGSPIGVGSDIDLKAYSKAIVDSEPWLLDPKCLPIPWRDVHLNRRLKFAIMWDDGVVKPTPPILRALTIAREALEADGHEVVSWVPTGHHDALAVLGKLLTADGGQSIRTALEQTGEPWHAEMDTFKKASVISAYELWQLQHQRSLFQAQYLEQWNQTGIDGLICPTAPFNTARHGHFIYIGYTGVFNILDYCATSFPTGVTVNKLKDQLDQHYQPLSPICKTVNEQYNKDLDLMSGLPVNLQLVARRSEEEKVLSMTSLIETRLTALNA
ncbi:general amidase [Fusarium albosuccineum]|uniref:General amidase n=1 Tax=Fusarium albosuccineum TaxID=1237068 RepID=A0A8H4P194_9HYPO|nr:general amidase [Fusarium albosuccineum]